MKKQIWRQVERMARGLGLVLVGGMLVAGCATTKPETTPQGQFSDPPPDIFPQATNGTTNVTTNGPEGGVLASLSQDGDRFQVGDLVTVKFSGTIDQNLETHEERIKEDGTITLPYIVAVVAAGKTPGELQKEIHDRYVPDYYKRLTVTVHGEQRVYYVGGYVRQPGRQVYLGTTTVTKAIQSAGDFTDYADKRIVELTRRDGKRFTVDCIKASKDPNLDLPVYPGDKIHVPMRDLKSIFRW
jgi:protein involved in polysaccharide export with SLBB domain